MNKLQVCLLSGMLICLLHLEGTQSITYGPQNTAVLLGNTLILNCSSDSVSGIDFVWYIVDQNTGGNEATLVGCLPAGPPPPPYRFIVSPSACDLIVDSVTEAETLLYRCEPLGDRSASASVVVLDPENYFSPLENNHSSSGEQSLNISINESFTVTSTLKFSGSMSPVLEWSTDGLTQINQFRSEQIGELTETVTLLATVAGEYRVSCKASFIPARLSSVEDLSQNNVTVSVAGSNEIIVHASHYATTRPIDVSAFNYKRNALIEKEELQVLDKYPQRSLSCECTVCSCYCIPGCEDWEIAAMFFSALTGFGLLLMLIGLIVNSENSMIWLGLGMMACSLGIFCLIVIGSNFCTNAMQCILVIVFTVGGFFLMTIMSVIFSLIGPSHATVTPQYS